MNKYKNNFDLFKTGMNDLCEKKYTETTLLLQFAIVYLIKNNKLLKLLAKELKEKGYNITTDEKDSFLLNKKSMDELEVAIKTIISNETFEKLKKDYELKIKKYGLETQEYDKLLKSTVKELKDKKYNITVDETKSSLLDKTDMNELETAIGTIVNKKTHDDLQTKYNNLSSKKSTSSNDIKKLTDRITELEKKLGIYGKDIISKIITRTECDIIFKAIGIKDYQIGYIAYLIENRIQDIKFKKIFDNVDIYMNKLNGDKNIKKERKLIRCRNQHFQEYLKKTDLNVILKFISPFLDITKRDMIKLWLLRNKKNPYYLKIFDDFEVREIFSIDLKDIENFEPEDGPKFETQFSLEAPKTDKEYDDFYYAYDPKNIRDFLYNWLNQTEVGSKWLYVKHIDPLDNTKSRGFAESSFGEIVTVIDRDPNAQKNLYETLKGSIQIDCDKPNYGLDMVRINIGGTAFAYPIIMRYGDSFYVIKIFPITEEDSYKRSMKSYQKAYRELDMFNYFNAKGYKQLHHVVKGNEITNKIGKCSNEYDKIINNYDWGKYYGMQLKELNIKYFDTVNPNPKYVSVEHFDFLNDNCGFHFKKYMVEKYNEYIGDKIAGLYEIINMNSQSILNLGKLYYTSFLSPSTALYYYEKMIESLKDGSYNKTRLNNILFNFEYIKPNGTIEKVRLLKQNITRILHTQERPVKKGTGQVISNIWKFTTKDGFEKYVDHIEYNQEEILESLLIISTTGTKYSIALNEIESMEIKILYTLTDTPVLKALPVPLRERNNLGGKLILTITNEKNDFFDDLSFIDINDIPKAIDQLDDILFEVKPEREIIGGVVSVYPNLTKLEKRN